MPRRPVVLRRANCRIRWAAAMVAAAGVLCPHDHAGAAQVAVTWTGGAGDWNTAAKWSPAVVPNNGADTYNVFIDGGKTGVVSAVTLNASATIDNLTVDAGDSLTLSAAAGAHELRLAPASGSATITNNGQLN